MNTNEMPKAHAELLDALHRQDEQARQMKLSEGFTERVLERMKSEECPPLRRRERDEESPQCGTPTLFAYRKFAAIFLAAAFLGGLAWASIRILVPLSSPKGVVPPSEGERGATLPSDAVGGAASPIRFSDIRLDSILTVVSAHYGKVVCFRSEEPRSMKLITTWNRADSLTAFIEHLNMFDGLHLTLQGDTIFVTAGTPKPHPLTPSPKGEGGAFGSEGEE